MIEAVQVSTLEIVSLATSGAASISGAGSWPSWASVLVGSLAAMGAWATNTVGDLLNPAGPEDYLGMRFLRLIFGLLNWLGTAKPGSHEVIQALWFGAMAAGTIVATPFIAAGAAWFALELTLRDPIPLGGANW